MKIYQIHEYGGEWEDRFDDIVGTYLDKRKAMEKMVALAEEHKRDVEQSRKCAHCPLWDDWSRYDDVILQKTAEYCTEFVKQSSSDSEYEDEFGCINYAGYVEKTFFRIEEVEVEE